MLGIGLVPTFYMITVLLDNRAIPSDPEQCSMRQAFAASTELLIVALPITTFSLPKELFKKILLSISKI